MRRLAILALATAAAFGVSSSVTFAGGSTSGAHFQNVSSSVNSAGTLVVSFSEYGLGQATTNYKLTANASATYACINGGGNHPKAANKETVVAPLVVSASFNPINGHVTATLSGGPLSPGSFTCPSGQTLVLAAVSYTNITLADTTNHVTTAVPNASRTFYAV
jgi:hypothetical protein